MPDPFLSPFRFEVLLAPGDQPGGEALAATAAFSEVSGLEITLEAIAVREGGYNAGVRQLVGRASHPPLVLKRGVTADPAFWQWVQACLSGRFPLPYLDGQVVVWPADGSAQRAAAWSFTNGIVTQVRSAELSATGNAVPIEELHIAHEGLVREVG